MRRFAWPRWMKLVFRSSPVIGRGRPAQKRRAPITTIEVVRPEVEVEREIREVLTDGEHCGFAIASLGTLEGMQAEKVLARLAGEETPNKFCTPDERGWAPCVHLAKYLRAEAALEYIPMILGSNDAQRDAAIVIVRAVCRPETMNQVQARLVSLLQHGTVGVRMLILRTLSLPDAEPTNSTQDRISWYGSLEEHAEGIAAALDCDLGPGTAEFQHAVLELISEFPCRRDAAGVQALKFIGSQVDRLRAAAVWARVSFLALRDHAGLEKELPVYLTDDETVQSAACVAINDYRTEPSASAHSLLGLAEQLLPRALKLDGSTPVAGDLALLISKLPCKIPLAWADALEQANRTGRLTNSSYARLARKLERNWCSPIFVSAVMRLLDLEREATIILTLPGCPWATAINMLLDADAKKLGQTLSRPPLGERTPNFVRRLLVIAGGTSVRPGVGAVSQAFEQGAASVLMSLCDTPAVQDVMWSEVGNTSHGASRALELIFGKQTRTWYRKLLRLLERARSLNPHEVIFALRKASQIRMTWLGRRAVFNGLVVSYQANVGQPERTRLLMEIVYRMNAINPRWTAKIVAAGGSLTTQN